MIDYNEYVLASIARERQARMQAFATQRTLLRSLGLPRRPLRIRVGHALIQAGRWMLRQGPTWAEERRRLA